MSWCGTSGRTLVMSWLSASHNSYIRSLVCILRIYYLLKPRPLAV